jgi:hypothetical protein
LDICVVKPKQIAEMKVPNGPRRLIKALEKRAVEIDKAMLKIENARKNT